MTIDVIQSDSSGQDEFENFDVVIVGGGIVGLTLANALLDSDFSVAVVERGAVPTIDINASDIRVSAINLAASDYFKHIGVWPYLQQRFCAYQQMHVWDTTGLGQIHFDSADQGLSDLGHIIENSVLVQALLARLKEASNICLYQSSNIKSIQRIDSTQKTENEINLDEIDSGTQSYRVVLENGKKLQASLLVGADGGRSSVREIAGIELSHSSYQQQGLVCAVATEKSHQQTAWQCFMPTGPLAFLPLFNGNSSIVWSLDDEKAQEMFALNDEDFKLALAEASEYQLGDIVAVSERKLFPLAHGHVNEYVQQGLALVGDAAHTIHPLAGQGANLGIADAICLAQIIKDARAANRQWYALHTLLKYQRQRKVENRVMEMSMTGFKALFGQENPLLCEVRNAGLNMVDRIPVLKKLFIGRALGS